MDSTNMPSPADDGAVAVLAAFSDEGWSLNHIVRSHGRIACGECGEESRSSEWSAGAEHRIEGASDPDDMQLVVGAACPRCHGKGAMLFVYGPAASAEDTDALAGLDLSDVTDPVAAPS